MTGPNDESAATFPPGPVAIKTELSESEPFSLSKAANEGAIATVAGEESPNILIPKKKRARRSPSSDEDLPPPLPPMRTIRLERQLEPEGHTLEWNILDEAQEKGMVGVWGPEEEARDIVGGEAMELNAVSGPSDMGPAAQLLGPGSDEVDPEEIARRLEEKYGEKKKIKVGCFDFAGVA